MKSLTKKEAIGTGFLAIVLLSVLAYTISGWKYDVEVRLPDGSAVQGATVWLSYVSDPSPPNFTTDSKGRAHIPRKRATNGDWHSIIATYTDAKGQEYIGSHRGSSRTFPVHITMSRRNR